MSSMRRTLLTLITFFFLPAVVCASSMPGASFIAARSLLSASSSPGNAYATGVSVVITAPIDGDLSAVGGSIISAAPVGGDSLLLAGSIQSRAPIGGDIRIMGGSIHVEKSIAGDLVAFGFSVFDDARVAGNVFIVAANTTLTNGASGPVTIYGNNISLAGDFKGDVNIVASGRLTLVPGTTIRGALSYESPEPAFIPASVTIDGGTTYTNTSYLPDIGASRFLALFSLGFFLLIRILSVLILAGLLAGLFPKLARKVVDRAYTKSPQSILLTALLGFAVCVAAPVLALMLILTFVGIGLAFLLLLAYLLIIFLAFLYAGILLGSLYARRFLLREIVLWRDGVLGMLALSLIALVPVVGSLVVASLVFFAEGALLLIFFHFAFSREAHTPEIL